MEKRIIFVSIIVPIYGVEKYVKNVWKVLIHRAILILKSFLLTIVPRTNPWK